MRTETALKRRDSGISSLRYQFSHAARFGITSAEMNANYAKLCDTVCKGAPLWVRNYLDGYRQALNDKLYQEELIFGGFIAGTFYSVHKDRADYYETNGIEPRDYADDGRVTMRGHYWRQSIDAGTPKPFFHLQTKESSNAAP